MENLFVSEQQQHCQVENELGNSNSQQESKLWNHNSYSPINQRFYPTATQIPQSAALPFSRVDQSIQKHQQEAPSHTTDTLDCCQSNFDKLQTTDLKDTRKDSHPTCTMDRSRTTSQDVPWDDCTMHIRENAESPFHDGDEQQLSDMMKEARLESQPNPFQMSYIS
eukprot:gene9168-1460_t